MAKVNGFGQAAVISKEDEQKFFEALPSDRDRALFAICLYTGCRVSEALQLTRADVTDQHITFRRETTKGKHQTRQVPIAPQLAAILGDYDIPTKGYIFPGRKEDTHLTRLRADQVLKEAQTAAGLEGMSTHSFRRSALTRMHNAGIPLAVIKKISGHSTLAALQRYLEVEEVQVLDAIFAI
jgi:integrase/recombinase XerD